MKKSLYILIFIFIIQISKAEVIDTVFSNPGNTIYLELFNTTENITLNDFELELYCSNPAVAYPYKILFITNDTLDYELEPINGRLFSLILLNEIQINEISKIELAVKLLNGNDSLALYTFENILINSTEYQKNKTLFINRQIPVGIEHYRFAYIDKIYPNPATRNQILYFKYRIDRESSVRFEIYNLTGKLLHINTLEKVEAGDHIYEFIPDIQFGIGMYVVKLRTLLGNSYRKFIINQ